MFGRGRDDDTVTCPACGRTLDREDAREYDKYGDRFDRRGKSFEHFCKPCHDDLCLQGRDGLEATLVDIGAGKHADTEFFERFAAEIEGRDGSIEEW
jgi:hypothetical protein